MGMDTQTCEQCKEPCGVQVCKEGEWICPPCNGARIYITGSRTPKHNRKFPRGALSRIKTKRILKRETKKKEGLNIGLD